MHSAKFEKVLVETMEEGSLKNVLIQVHGRPVRPPAEVDPISDPSMVSAKFDGKPGARLRVRIFSRGAPVFDRTFEVKQGSCSVETGNIEFKL